MLQRINEYVSVVFNEEGFTFCNCLWINDDVKAIIETGAGRALADIAPESIDLVINTHHHIDHIRGNDLFPRARVLLHPLSHEPMRYPELQTALSGWQELMEQDIRSSASNISVSPGEVFKAWRVDGEINDNEVIDCGHTKIVVLYTPGHCAGHCAFYLPDQDFAFLGDICLTKAGPWYGEPQADIDDFLHSIDRVLDLKPKTVATSHVTYMVTEPRESLIEYRDRILKREQRILEKLKDGPQTIHELAEHHLIYRLHPTQFVLFWEKCMLKKHLERLIAMGQVELIEDGKYHLI